jgi:hypothetical protein
MTHMIVDKNEYDHSSPAHNICITKFVLKIRNAFQNSEIHFKMAKYFISMLNYTLALLSTTQINSLT